eukprot:c12868_g1_i1.p1 GENE.c12868_g1_i1~~c12868_g1_i1.p1  ORF type:complete len:130 (-),score=14.95 c12868_g1_i1:14-403(-)
MGAMSQTKDNTDEVDSEEETIQSPSTPPSDSWLSKINWREVIFLTVFWSAVWWLTDNAKKVSQFLSLENFDGLTLLKAWSLLHNNLATVGGAIMAFLGLANAYGILTVGSRKSRPSKQKQTSRPKPKAA